MILLLPAWCRAEGFVCPGMSTACERACEGDMEDSGQWEHLLEGHLASLSNVAMKVPVCIIKIICKVQTWRWKGLHCSASFAKQDYLGILTGFEILAEVLHPLCIFHHVSAL